MFKRSYLLAVAALALLCLPAQAADPPQATTASAPASVQADIGAIVPAVIHVDKRSDAAKKAGMPEFEADQWLYDQHQAFRSIVGQMHTNRAGPAVKPRSTAESDSLRVQCLTAAVDYNRKAAGYKDGVFKQRQLPASLNIAECKMT